jgi:hypothetical protein
VVLWRRLGAPCSEDDVAQVAAIAHVWWRRIAVKEWASRNWMGRRDRGASSWRLCSELSLIPSSWSPSRYKAIGDAVGRLWGVASLHASCECPLPITGHRIQLSSAERRARSAQWSHVLLTQPRHEA